MKKLVVIAIMLVVGVSFAQNERVLNLNEKTNLIEVTYFHDNGQVSQTGFYTKDGKLHGDWISYNEEGKKITSAQYNKGVKTGKWFFWSGDMLREVDYSQNKIADVNTWVMQNSVAASRLP